MARPDFSDCVAHFTKSTSPCSGDMGNMPATALERLIQILSQGTIKASTMPWTNKDAVCFTECPFYSMFEHKENYSAYGLGFKKKTVYNSGGGPAIYMRQNVHDAQLNNFAMNSNSTIKGFHKDVYAFVTPFRPSYGTYSPKCDYTSEREWRTPQSFTFSVDDIEFITVQSYSDVATITSIVHSVSQEKFLIFDMIEKIETLWPTHKI